MQPRKPRIPTDDVCISVIIPFYNVHAYLRACLDSVLSQTHRNLDVILVDDGSTDGSMAIAQEYAARDKRVRVFDVGTGGVSVARNAGVAAAIGDWIGFADSDDLLPPDSLETLLQTALQNEAAIAMGGYAEHHGAEGGLRFTRPVPAKTFVCHTAAEAQRYFLTWGQFMTHMWTKLFRRDVFEGVAFPVGRIYEDIAVMPMLLDNAKSVAVTNHTVYHYHVRPGSLSTGVDIEHQMDGLSVRLDYADYIRANYPELLGLANDAVLAIGCNILGKIRHIGRDKAPEQWTRTVDEMRAVLPAAALQNPMYRLLAAAFRRDPDLVARFTHFLLVIDGML